MLRAHQPLGRIGRGLDPALVLAPELKLVGGGCQAGAPRPRVVRIGQQPPPRIEHRHGFGVEPLHGAGDEMNDAPDLSCVEGLRALQLEND